MPLDEYLVTRLVEIVVHGDDLAASLGVDASALAGSTFNRLIDYLLIVAWHAHGRACVVWSLSRRERDAVEALRIL